MLAWFSWLICLTGCRLTRVYKGFLNWVNWGEKWAAPWHGLGAWTEETGRSVPCASFISLCCLAIDAVWTAALNSCYHDIHALMDWTPNCEPKKLFFFLPLFLSWVTFVIYFLMMSLASWENAALWTDGRGARIYLLLCSSTHIHTQTHTHKHTYTHTHMHVYIYSHMCTQMSTHEHTLTHKDMHVHAPTHGPIRVYVHTCTYMCTYINLIKVYNKKASWRSKSKQCLNSS